jgi:hypothetical protein
MGLLGDFSYISYFLEAAMSADLNEWESSSSSDSVLLMIMASN